jgi:hypothetical protein
VHLHVLFGRADVDPVAAIDVGDERFARSISDGKKLRSIDQGVSFGMRSKVSGSRT